MTDSPLDAAVVKALVAEVVRRVVAAQAAPPRPPASAPVSGATSAAGPASGPPAAPMPGWTINDRVVSLAQLDRVPAGVNRVGIHAAAVITPSARDRAKEAGITLVRGSENSPTAATERPFIIAQAACRGDASGRAAAIARAIVPAQQLPASGLADVIVALASHASKDGARGVLLTARPAVAVVLANRSASLRAVTARDAASMAAAAADAAANLLVIDPTVFPAAALERVCADFHRTSFPSVPAELAGAPAGCGCTTRAH